MDWKTGNGRLTRKRIVKVTGIKDRETISSKTTRLRQIGLIRVWTHKTGENTYVRYYHVAGSEEQMRQYAVTYLVHKPQKSKRGYVSAKTGQGTAGKPCHKNAYIHRTISENSSDESIKDGVKTVMKGLTGC